MKNTLIRSIVGATVVLAVAFSLTPSVSVPEQEMVVRENTRLVAVDAPAVKNDPFASAQVARTEVLSPASYKRRSGLERAVEGRLRWLGLSSGPEF